MSVYEQLCVNTNNGLVWDVYLSNQVDALFVHIIFQKDNTGYEIGSTVFLFLES